MHQDRCRSGPNTSSSLPWKPVRLQQLHRASDVKYATTSPELHGGDSLTIKIHRWFRKTGELGFGGGRVDHGGDALMNLRGGGKFLVLFIPEIASFRPIWGRITGILLTSGVDERRQMSDI